MRRSGPTGRGQANQQHMATRRTAITTEDFPRCWSVSTAPWFSMLIEHGQNGWILFCYFTSVQLTSRVPHVGLLAHCLVGSWERFAEWDHEEFRSRASLRLCFTLGNHGLPFGLHSIQLYKAGKQERVGQRKGGETAPLPWGFTCFASVPLPCESLPYSTLLQHFIGIHLGQASRSVETSFYTNG